MEAMEMYVVFILNTYLWPRIIDLLIICLLTLLIKDLNRYRVESFPTSFSVFLM